MVVAGVGKARLTDGARLWGSEYSHMFVLLHHILPHVSYLHAPCACLRITVRSKVCSVSALFPNICIPTCHGDVPGRAFRQIVPIACSSHESRAERYRIHIWRGSSTALLRRRPVLRFEGKCCDVASTWAGSVLGASCRRMSHARAPSSA